MRLFTAVTLVATLGIFGTPASATAHPWYEPILTHDRADFATWTCIIHAESRSTWAHPNLKDSDPSASNSGIFQIQDSTFHAHFGVKSLHIWQATPRQQAIAAINIRWADHDDGYNGFGPWRGDGCVR